MDEPIFKNYYAIIPAYVRYDTNLTPNAKLLYGEITALTNEKGYCWANNAYFAKLYGVSKVSISKWINQLESKGYIKSVIQYREGTKEILNRYLTIVNDPIKEKFKTSKTIINDPTKEKFKDNNTKNNTINNNISKDIYSVIDNLDNSQEFKNTLKDFAEMRKTIKKPLTEKSFKLLINKLNKITTNENKQILILEESILNNWQGVFDLKENKGAKTYEYNGNDRNFEKELAGIDFTKRTGTTDQHEDIEQWLRENPDA